MPLSQDSFDVLDSVKKTGRPCKFIMLYKDGNVVSLVAYRRGSDETYFREAKKAGHGTEVRGVVDNQPLVAGDANLAFKLLRTKDLKDAPVRPLKLREFLNDKTNKGDLKAKPSFDFVENLPAVADDASAVQLPARPQQQLPSAQANAAPAAAVQVTPARPAAALPPDQRPANAPAAAQVAPRPAPQVAAAPAVPTRDAADSVVSAVQRKVAEMRRDLGAKKQDAQAVAELNDAAAKLGRQFRDVTLRKSQVPYQVAVELELLLKEPLLSAQTKADLKAAVDAVYETNWARQKAESEPIRKRVVNALDLLRIQAATGVRSNDDVQKATQGQAIIAGLDEANRLAGKEEYLAAIGKSRAAMLLAAEVTSHAEAYLGGGSGTLQDWHRLDVRGKFSQLQATESFDGAAAAEVRAVFQQAVQRLEAGEPDEALTAALGIVGEYDLALVAYEAAKKACAAFGDISTMLKKDSEAAHAMHLFLAESTAPGHDEWSKRAKAFRDGNGGNTYYKAKECAAEGLYRQALSNIQTSKAHFAELRAEWMKIRGPEVKRLFDQRIAASPNGAERKIAQGIGEESYLQNLNIAESIARQNKFDATKLEPEELAVINGYTTEDFNVINPMLRGTKPTHFDDRQWQDKRQQYDQYCKSLVLGLNKLPGFTGDVFRGCALPDSLVATMRSTMTFSDKAFVSTSYSHGFPGKYQMLIRARGKNGKDVSLLSIYKEAEGEVLFLPGTEFKIVQITDDIKAVGPNQLHPKGQLFIVLEEVT